MDFSKSKNEEVIRIYCEAVKELRTRKIIRTKNVLGELGEYLAISFYNSHPGLPKLQSAPVGAKNIDAISRDGERYSIKSCTTNITGVFYGLQPEGSDKQNKQLFEYVIVCKFNDYYEIEYILELSWDMFIKHKHWHSRMGAWNLSISEDLISDSKIIFKKE